MIGVKSFFLLQIIVMMQSTLAFASRYARHLTTHPSFIHHRHAIGSRLVRYSFASTKVPVEVSPSDHGTNTMTDFAGSSILDNRIIETLQSPGLNITTPTPIQSHSLPLLFQNYDVMASSATGSGKTLMFCIPILNKLLGTCRKRISSNRIGQPSALIISPTRELSVQTYEVLNTFLKSDTTLKNDIFVSLATGGSDTRSQRQALPKCNVLVGTPGRICQFLDERNLSLQSIDYLVIDEADRLLDMGFEKDLTRISRSFSRQNNRQSVLCSATFPIGVQRLAADFLNERYYFVSVGKVGGTHSQIEQKFEWVDIFVKSKQNPKVKAVVKNVEQFWSDNLNSDQKSVIVFTNTKDGANEYGRAISRRLGSLRRQIRVIHGDKPQVERNRAIEDFKNGRVSLLVATDVAARGLDVSTVGLVLQADAPRDIDTYTHRAGRTGRAGRSGSAITLLDAKSGFGLASGLVNLLTDAGQSDFIPSWLRGQAHINQARSLEEEMKINAGSFGSPENGSEVEVHNEEFSGQDFRRNAAEGTYGAGKDNSYRSFEDDAYSDVIGIDMSERESNKLTSLESHLDPTMNDDVSVGEQDALEAHAFEFKRSEPSTELVRAVADIDGSSIGVTPKKKVLDALQRKSQKLRFEYIGLFPFQDISPLLMTSTSKDTTDRVKILMVAEKPSIAKAIADSLSPKRGATQRRGISRALPVYEFTTDQFAPEKGQRCLVRVTSVVGHLYSLGFDLDGQTQNKRINPRDYFTLPVTKVEEATTSKLRVIDHLKALAGDSQHLVLWLDCDPEGENIAHEVIAVCRRAIYSNASSFEEEKEDTTRIHRAKFSAITSEALKDAFSALQQPDPALSRSVDARQELDLRIGVSLTRLLTWKCVNLARSRFSSSTRMISYGPCQTPALSFCIDRLREIEAFVPEKYWEVDVQAALPDSKSYSLRWKVPTDDAVIDTRGKGGGNIDCATFNQQSAERLVERAKGVEVIVTEVTHTSEKIQAPVGLNTVALLEAGSKAMGMSPKSVMSVAEKLYSAGYISYPRTETTKYDPNGFDARSLLREHCNSDDFGKAASYLLRTRKTSKPPRRGKDCGDHPPITPLRAATRGDVGGGAAWRVYEFVTRTFIGSLHNDLELTRIKASLALPGSEEAEFEIELVTVDSLGFADACRWVLRDLGTTTSGKAGNNLLQEGQRLKLTKSSVEEKRTKPPRFLQEFELIRLMDANRIGTDASMSVHVTNIVDRGYVTLCDETGVPLRPPRPPSQRKSNLPRQIGRYMVPTPLGANLLELFGHDEKASGKDSPALLSHPSIRRQMEEEVTQIANSNIDKEFCLEKNLDWFEKRYDELETSLTYERIGQFGKSLRSSNDQLRYLQKLEAFEAKVATPNKGQTNKGKTQNSPTKRQKHKAGREKQRVVTKRKKQKSTHTHTQ